MKPQRLTVAVLFATFGMLATGQAPIGPFRSIAGILCTVALNKTQYSMGEDIQVTVTLKNQSKKRVYYDMNQPRLKLSVGGDVLKEYSYIPNDYYQQLDRQSFPFLDPNCEWSTTFSLFTKDGETPAGQYILEVIYPFDYSYKGNYGSWQHGVFRTQKVAFALSERPKNA